MKFTGVLRAPLLNLPAYRTLMADALAGAIAEATRIWLEATVDEIPTWSGASRATFLPLASEINFNVNIALAAGAPYRIPLGLQHADGDVSIKDAGKGIVHFTYLTTLPHLIWNEFNNANITPDPTKFPPPIELRNPGPYHFQAKGLAAFEQYASKVRLPSPFNSLRVKEYKVV